MLVPSRERYVPVQYVPLRENPGVLRMESAYIPGGFIEMDPYEVKAILREGYVDVVRRWGALLRNCEYVEPLPAPVEELELPPPPPEYPDETPAREPVEPKPKPAPKPRRKRRAKKGTA